MPGAFGAPRLTDIVAVFLEKEANFRILKYWERIFGN